MGRIVIVENFARAMRQNGANVSDVIVNPGGGANITAEHFADPGDDSFPLTTDYAVAVQTIRKGGMALAGYVDPINSPKAQAGEKRIYARDSGGASICEIWLKADGSILVSNDQGSIELASGGDINIMNSGGHITMASGGDIDLNGVTIDASGNVSMPALLDVAGKDFATHTHIGSPTAPPGGVTPTGVVI